MTTSSTKPIRAFIAVRPNEAAQAELVRVQRELKKSLACSDLRIKWTDPSTFHITLLFLGDILEEGVTGVIRAMKSVGRVTSPGVCELSGLGLFKKSGAIWVGIDAPPALLELQKELAVALEMEPGRFHAHFTLGRIKAGRADQQLFPESEAIDNFAESKIMTNGNGSYLESMDVNSIPFEISSIELVQSEILPEGARHTALGFIALSQR